MSNYVPRLKKVYNDKIAPELFKELGYSSFMQVPAIKKIVVSMGVGEALANKKLLDAAVTDLTAITGQKAVKTKAKKSIANFKLREGNEVGVMVTLRGARMYEFLDRLITLHYLVLRISVELRLLVLMVMEIIRLVSLNRLSSLRSTSTKSNALQV